MADRVTKLRKSATATERKAQKRKEGERKLSSFGEDLHAVMEEQDMQEWNKQNTVEQTAQD
jgi:hypothetical protein